jgi:hypothetical protein
LRKGLGSVLDVLADRLPPCVSGGVTSFPIVWRIDS